MFRNYFKTAWRNIVRSKGYSAINIVGLATGMSVAMLIGLWVYYQVSYDRFFPGYEQIYSARLRFNNNGDIGVGPATPLPLADALKKDIPGIKYVAQADWMGPHALVVGEKKIYSNGATAGADFLKIFQYPLVEGRAADLLQSAYSVVLTQSTAKALFGNEPALNKTIRIDNSNNLTVKGVIADVPANASLQFNFVIPLSYLEATSGWAKNAASNWRDKSFQTFVTLAPNVRYAQVEPALAAIMKKYSPEDYKLFSVNLFFQPLKNWHLHNEFKNGKESGGLADYVKMFSVIGFIILLIACINFMNLSTARSEKRAREVGIRKAIGSQRKDLVFQFLAESVLMAIFAGALSLLIVYLSLPAFNTLTKTTIYIPFANALFWICITLYTLFTGLLAGSRPAFYLSSFNPVQVLKGSVQHGPSATLSRKALVVVQFTCSVALMVGTIIIYQQIQYAKDRPKGYDADRLVMTDVSNDLNRNYTSLKNELLQSGFVTSVTKSSSPATELWSLQRIDRWQGMQAGETMDISCVGVCDADYFKTLGMQMKEGRNFEANGSDSLNVIINEAAAEKLRFKNSIGEILTWHDIPQQVTITGVVKNALMNSPFTSSQPTIFIYAPGWSNIITYRLSSGVRTSDAIAKLTAIFNKYNPSYPFLYHFVDESYNSKFNFENLIGSLAGIFASLAIFISCLGLFGLAAYMAEQRNKEIGIRKVLGASVPQVWVLLSKEFVVLVVISCVLATPLAFYFLNEWLHKYPYRITITPFVFIAAGVAAVLITIATVSFQAIKAALSNPVKSLRSE